MANVDRGISTWDLVRSILSIAAMCLVGLVAYSTRLMVQGSEQRDADLSARIQILETEIGRGILPRSDERIMQIRRDIERIERDLERHIESD